ncbi:MAG TPA: hypothetical protein PLV64_09215 [Anaerolineales bacterium]|nr:hypothetical protein [Anaerolineales bacterium]
MGALRSISKRIFGSQLLLLYLCSVALMPADNDENKINHPSPDFYPDLNGSTWLNNLGNIAVNLYCPDDYTVRLSNGDFLHKKNLCENMWEFLAEAKKTVRANEIDNIRVILKDTGGNQAAEHNFQLPSHGALVDNLQESKKINRLAEHKEIIEEIYSIEHPYKNGWGVFIRVVQLLMINLTIGTIANSIYPPINATFLYMLGLPLILILDLVYQKSTYTRAVFSHKIPKKLTRFFKNKIENDWSEITLTSFYYILVLFAITFSIYTVFLHQSLIMSWFSVIQAYQQIFATVCLSIVFVGLFAFLSVLIHW